VERCSWRLISGSSRRRLAPAAVSECEGGIIVKGLHYLHDLTIDFERWIPGWPAVDHNEPDDVLAEAKVASGLYEETAPLAVAFTVALPAPPPAPEHPPEPRPLDWWRAAVPPAVVEEETSEPPEAVSGPSEAVREASTEEVSTDVPTGEPEPKDEG
jgi:hypothetical protein